VDIIDIHTHVFPDDLAPKAIEELERRANIKAFLNGTVSDLRRSMQEAGIALSVLQPVCTKPNQVRSINTWTEQFNHHFTYDDYQTPRSMIQPDILPFGTLYPGQEDWEEEINRLKRAGIRGIKLHPEYQAFDPNAPCLFPLYEKLQEENCIVLFHAGEDIGFPPPYHARPRRIAAVVEAFPDLRIIAAHMGGYNMWDEVEECLVKKDLYLDTSYTIGHLPTERLIHMMERHGFDRILFGTDSPWKDQSEEVQNILRLDIPDEAKGKILWENAHNLLHT